MARQLLSPPALPPSLPLPLPPPFLPPPVAVIGRDGTRHHEGATYARTPGYRPRLLDVHVPAGAERVPLVVWIHGGWADGDRRCPSPTVPVDLLLDVILTAGLAVATIDYRHSLEAPFPAQLHDVKAAIRYLRYFADVLGVDGARLGVWGESAGGHLAALAALTDDADLEGAEGVTDGNSTVQAVVDWYGVSDISSAYAAFPGVPAGIADPCTALLGVPPDERPDLARAASPVTYADRAAAPFLLIHGTDDRVVPCAQSELLAERLQVHNDTTELITIPGAGHLLLGAPDIEAIVDDSANFLAYHLTGSLLEGNLT